MEVSTSRLLARHINEYHYIGITEYSLSPFSCNSTCSAMTPPLPIDEFNQGPSAIPSAVLHYDGHNHMGGEPSAAAISSAAASPAADAGKDHRQEDEKSDDVEDKVEHIEPEPRDEAAAGRSQDVRLPLLVTSGLSPSSQ